MSPKHTNSFKNKSLTILGAAVLAISLSFGGYTFLNQNSTGKQAQAALDANGQGYTDSLNNPHQEAVYNYNYENILPTAPGYFEIVIPKLTGANPIDLYEVTSISETFPLETTTYANVAGTQTTTTSPANAVYAATNGALGIRISPQITCVTSATGCTTGDIPGSVPSRLTIKVALKTSAPTTVSVSSGAGSVKFPQGIDISSLQWRLNAAYVKTNDVLDPAIMATAAIQGENGTGNPIIGKPYTVVTSGIKAVNAASLNAPNGTCKTTIGGTIYTGTGITNGVCTINIPVNATATAIPAGTVDLNDGGTPRAIVLIGVPYTSATPVTGFTPLTAADVPSLTVNCPSAAANSTTNCTFTLPANKTLPTDFKLSIGSGATDAGNSTPAQSCVATGASVTCTNVPTGNNIGDLPIYGNFTNPTASKTATGETVLITGINMAKADWNYSPNKGDTSPLFRSNDQTGILINNFKTVYDANPSNNTRYTCKLEYRLLNDRLSSTPAWSPIDNSVASPKAYITGSGANSGCSFNLTKANRANNLNLSLRLTVTDTTITNPSTTNPNTFVLNDEYIFRFLGAGIATGGI